MATHVAPHPCEHCGKPTRNKHYCSQACWMADNEAKRQSKMHPCPICGDPTNTTICSKASCLSEFMRQVGHSRVKARMRVCKKCKRELPIAAFHRMTGDDGHRHYFFSLECHDCRPEHAYVPGTDEPAQEEETKLVEPEAEPAAPSIPLAGEAHGRWEERAWSDLRLGDPCFPVPGNSTSAAPFAT